MMCGALRQLILRIAVVMMKAHQTELANRAKNQHQLRRAKTHHQPQATAAVAAAAAAVEMSGMMMVGRRVHYYRLNIQQHQ